MTVEDARKLSPDAQEALRKRAVSAHIVGGLRQREVASLFGVSTTIVCKWVKQFRASGETGLNARRKGPEKGFGTRLTQKQAEQIRSLVIDRCPEQLKLPFSLWTRDAVRELIRLKFKIAVSVRTAGNYLREWGFTPQKPVRRAYEQSSKAVQAWLEEIYPGIARRAKQEKALIYWSDEMGLRSDHLAGRSYGLRGQAPVIASTGKRFKCSMISAVTNLGHLCFRVFEGTFTVKLFLDYLSRLIKQARRKVFLIVDGHPVHRAKIVQAWREEHKDEMEIFYLPGYSPQLNPDEMLNQDVKSNVFNQGRPKDVAGMKASLRSYLFSTQKQPTIVRNYFHEKHVQYALPDAM